VLKETCKVAKTFVNIQCFSPVKIKSTIEKPFDPFSSSSRKRKKGLHAKHVSNRLFSQKVFFFFTGKIILMVIPIIASVELYLEWHRATK